MVKKIFSILVVVVILAALYSIFKKENPRVDTLFNQQKNREQISAPVNSSGTNATVAPATGNSAFFLNVTEPVNNSTVAVSSVNVSGKTKPNASVTVDDRDFKADANGNFSTKVALLEGPNNIYVIASDDYGNNAEKDLVVNLESTQ